MKHMQSTIVYGAALALAVLSGSANAQSPSADGNNAPAGRTATTSSTQKFVDQATYANRAEIAEARYVSTHSHSQPVKQFAQKMIDDHGASLRQLEQVASSSELVIPKGVDRKDRTSLAKLKGHKGADLDKAYADDQVKDHKEVIAKFMAAADDSGVAASVRDYAKQALPTLNEHLQMAQQLVTTESNGE